MKKSPSQTLLDYSILSLAVSSEVYGIIIVCNHPPPLSAGKKVEPLTEFSKGSLTGSQFSKGGYCRYFQGVAGFTKKVC